MRAVERLILENQKNRDKEKKKMNTEPDDMMKEHEFKKPTYLNTNESVFQSKMNEGINNSPSVFDRQAIFRK